MAITIKVFGMLRSILGEASLVLDPPPATVHQLLNELSVRYGERVREELLDEGGNLDYAYGIFVAGEKLNNLSAKIEDGVEVVIASIIAGGDHSY
ncbi:MAG: MoaD/ThiS family protein [Chloroflexi bacterium]|nr:MoaD/ThiS family protein [Chloroflexota bacterium]